MLCPDDVRPCYRPPRSPADPPAPGSGVDGAHHARSPPRRSTRSARPRASRPTWRCACASSAAAAPASRTTSTSTSRPRSIASSRSQGVKVVVDEMSLMYLVGTEIDYVEGLQGAGFKFNNPNVKSTCGCGSSFSV